MTSVCSSIIESLERLISSSYDSCLALLFAAVGQFSQVEAQQSEQQRPNTSNHQGPIKVDPAYSRIANETGGQVYVMDRTQIDQMSKVVTLTSLGEHDPLLSI